MFIVINCILAKLDWKWMDRSISCGHIPSGFLSFNVQLQEFGSSCRSSCTVVRETVKWASVSGCWRGLPRDEEGGQENPYGGSSSTLTQSSPFTRAVAQRKPPKLKPKKNMESGPHTELQIKSVCSFLLTLCTKKVIRNQKEVHSLVYRFNNPNTVSLRPLRMWRTKNWLWPSAFNGKPFYFKWCLSESTL